MRISLIFVLFLSALAAHAQDSVAFQPLPWQVSLFPGISTHGRADRQTVNHLSINLFGGMEKGLRGAEMGGVFNIDLRDVRYVQCAGMLNLDGGRVQGMQAAGLVNLVADSVHGAQFAGLANIDQRGVHGVQAAGLGNLSRGTVEGVQAAGMFNYAHRLKGVQIGIVNVADSSDGYSIGLVNIIHRNGLRQVSVSEEDVTGLSVAFKSGTRRLYGILLAGFDDWSTTKVYSAGAGVGTQVPFGGVWTFSTELVSQNVFTDSWKYLGEIVRVKPSLSFRLTPHTSLSAGPTFNLYQAVSKLPAGSKLTDIPGSGWPSNSWNSQTVAWIGASLGLNFW